jgi:hypothetical protein
MIARSARLLAVLVIVVLGAGSAGLVRAHAPDPTLGGGALERDQVLPFRWRSGAEPPAALRTAILAAAADVTESRQSNAALFGYDATAVNPIGYGAGATCGVNGIACFTRTMPDRFTMWFRQQGYAFDWGVLRWCQSYATWPNGCFDVENIALDEFGHVEGLGHHENFDDDRDYLDAIVQTISRTKPNAGYNAHAFGACDVAALQRMYDIETTAQKISTCLDLATVLVISANPTSVLRGADTTLTATLRIADSSTYGQLRTNPLSKRIVTLQRRSVGTTTWSTVGTMTAGTLGTYTLRAMVSASTEFRAIFTAPSDEGLRSDASPALTVTVSGCSRPPCPL